jgi:ribulose kinase
MYSSEWGFAKLLHWLRHNPAKRQKFAGAFEHCDMVAATLCGITDPKHVRRSVCAMGHKWLWNSDLGGLPPESFLAKVDPLFTGVRGKLEGECALSDQIAGRLSPSWAEKLGLRAGIPIPVGALDAHWDAIGAGAREGDVVNVVGTSTCINGGGIPQNNPVLNQVYANVLGRPVLVPSSKVTGIGSAIFAFLAAGTFRSIEECQDQICPAYTEFTPQPEEREIYDELYALFRRMYFDFGKPFRDSCFGDVLPKLIQMARVSRVPQ